MSNKKLYLFIFILLFCISFVNAEDNKESQEYPQIIEKIFSGDSDPDNGICDDGENLIIDKDCGLGGSLILSGELFLLGSFLRLLLIVSAILYYYKSPYFDIAITFTIIDIIFISFL